VQRHVQADIGEQHVAVAVALCGTAYRRVKCSQIGHVQGLVVVLRQRRGLLSLPRELVVADALHLACVA
jgi:hypothetical protein